MAQQVYSLAGVYLTQSDATPLFKLGQRVWAKNGSEFIYCQTNGANAVGNANRIPVNHDAAPITTSNAARGDRVGVTMATTMADNEYGWFQIYGEGSVSVLTLCAANVILCTTATAGSLDDTTSSQKQVEGLYLTSTNSGGTTAITACTLNYPYVGATL